jgi:hypothetical protein
MIGDLFLLILDEDLDNFYLHGIFSDTPESWKTIEKITERVQYRVIRAANVICGCGPEYDEQF